MLNVHATFTFLKHDYGSVCEAFNLYEDEGQGTWPFGDVSLHEGGQTMTVAYEDGETREDDGDDRAAVDDWRARFRRLGQRVVERFDPAAVDAARASAHWTILETRHLPFEGLIQVDGDGRSVVLHVVACDGHFAAVETDAGRDPMDADPGTDADVREYQRLVTEVRRRFAVWNADARMTTVALLPGPSADDAEWETEARLNDAPEIPVETSALTFGAMPESKLKDLETPELDPAPESYVPARRPAHALFDESYFAWRRQRMTGAP